MSKTTLLLARQGCHQAPPHNHLRRLAHLQPKLLLCLSHICSLDWFDCGFILAPILESILEPILDAFLGANFGSFLAVFDSILGANFGANFCAVFGFFLAVFSSVFGSIGGRLLPLLGRRLSLLHRGRHIFEGKVHQIRVMHHRLLLRAFDRNQRKFFCLLTSCEERLFLLAIRRAEQQMTEVGLRLLAVLVYKCLWVEQLKMLGNLCVEVVLVAQPAPKLKHAVEPLLFFQVSVGVLFLAFSTPGQLVLSPGSLSLLFVDLRPQAFVAEDVSTGQPLRVLCKNALADRTLELSVHLLEEMHR